MSVNGLGGFDLPGSWFVDFCCFRSLVSLSIYYCSLCPFSMIISWIFCRFSKIAEKAHSSKLLAELFVFRSVFSIDYRCSIRLVVTSLYILRRFRIGRTSDFIMNIDLTAEPHTDSIVLFTRL